MTRENAEKMGLELALIESEYKQTRKLFLEDAEISPEEQKTLDEIQKDINEIKEELKRLGVNLNNPVSKELKGHFVKLLELLQLYKKTAQVKRA